MLCELYGYAHGECCNKSKNIQAAYKFWFLILCTWFFIFILNFFLFYNFIIFLFNGCNFFFVTRVHVIVHVDCRTSAHTPITLMGLVGFQTPWKNKSNNYLDVFFFSSVRLNQSIVMHHKPRDSMGRFMPSPRPNPSHLTQGHRPLN